MRFFNSINKASKGIRFKRPSATNGSTVGTIWTVFLIWHDLQNRVPRVRSLLPLPKIERVSYDTLFIFLIESEWTQGTRSVNEHEFWAHPVDDEAKNSGRRGRQVRCGRIESSGTARGRSLSIPSAPATKKALLRKCFFQWNLPTANEIASLWNTATQCEIRLLAYEKANFISLSAKQKISQFTK